jgi:hypothetical protein
LTGRFDNKPFKERPNNSFQSTSLYIAAKADKAVKNTDVERKVGEEAHDPSEKEKGGLDGAIVIA